MCQAAGSGSSMILAITETTSPRVRTALEGFRLHCAVSQIRLELHNHVDSINGVDVKVLVKTSFRSDLLGRNIEFVGKDFGKSGVDLLFLRRKSRHGI